jgi:predicted GNAT superfamily acetyltransferase
MVTLRDVRPADLEAVRRLNQDARPAVTDMSAEETLRFAEEAAYFRVAEAGGDVVGFLIGLEPGLDYDSLNYRWFSERYPSFLYVDRVVVAEDHRSGGVGARFYADFERCARERGRPVLLCEVNLRPRNDGSLRFHARLGFEEVGTREPPGGKAVSMLAKELGPA